jgi:hypothetical protein
MGWQQKQSMERILIRENANDRSTDRRYRDGLRFI